MRKRSRPSIGGRSTDPRRLLPPRLTTSHLTMPPSVPVRRALISFLGVFLFATFLHAEEPLSVDENSFLKTPFDFSPPEERHLDQQWLVPPETPYPFPESKVVVRSGVRTIEINGTPIPTWSRSIPAIFTPGSPVERQLREMGVRLFIIDIGLTVDRYDERLMANAPEEAFAKFKSSADDLLAQVPDALIMVRLWMVNVSKDFPEKYPDALLAGPDGKTDWGIGGGGHTTRANSLNEWRRYCGEHLHKFIHRLGASPYASHVGGFYLAAMNSGEWWYPKGEGDPGWDYSRTRQTAFIRYVRQKYGDNEAIAKAWGIPNDDQLLVLPSLKERGEFPMRPNSKVSDYAQVLNIPVTNAAIYFARIIKAATSGRALAGMEIHMGGMTFPINGTVFLNHLLDCPDIDFFGGPTGYGERKPGGSPIYRALFTSLGLHDKLWLNEADLRTPTSYDTISGAQGEPPPDMNGMREVFIREFARGAVFNYSSYLMDFNWDWFLDPSIMKQLKEVLRADAIVQTVGLKRKAEIAFVTDQESQLYASYFANPTGRMLGEEGAKSVVDRIGASWDIFELRDFLASERFRQYKLVVFLNINALSEEERRQIEAVKSDNRTVLWMHDPGKTSLSARGAAPEELISSLVGMKMGAAQPEGVITLKSGAFERKGEGELIAKRKEDLPKTKLNIEVSLSDGAVGSPIGNQPSNFYCVDPSATTLGADEAGQAYFALKKHKEWTSVYSASCELKPWIIRKLAQQAGCHIWLETNDVSFASENLVAIHASESGEKELLLPEAVENILDIFSGESIHPDGTTLRFSMKKGETRFFALGVKGDVFEQAFLNQQKEIAAFKKGYPSVPVQVDFRTRYIPEPPIPGSTPLQTWGHTSQPMAILVAGPFAADSETMLELDEALVKQDPTLSWKKRDLAGRIGDHGGDYLQMIDPLPTLTVKAGLADWTAWKTIFPWNSGDRVGIGPGQSFAGALFLESKEPSEAQLHLYTSGEARVWIDGKELKADELGQFHIAVTLGPERKMVVFRVRGDLANPSGFSVKLSKKKPNLLQEGVVEPDFATTTPLPDSVTQWVPPQKEETEAPASIK